MVWRLRTVLLLAGLFVMACGPRVGPIAQTTSLPSPTPTQKSQPASTPMEPTPSVTATPTDDGLVASVACSGGPGASMAVVAGQFVYDVADPIRPRLVCRGANTVMRLLDAKTIAYTTVAGGHVVIMRRDLSTGAESRIAQLRLGPRPCYYGGPGWGWDGALEMHANCGRARAAGLWVGARGL